jgi:hypothetical protein
MPGLFTVAVATGLLFAFAASADAANYGACRAPIAATGHGQAVEPSLPDYGVGYARRQAIHIWVQNVIAADGPRFAHFRRARNISFTEDRGAGQIYITLKATPCR